MANCWFFQANPDDYDVDEYLGRFDYIYWSVKTGLHIREIRIGDDAYLWRARGKSNGPRGILARCIVAEMPKNNGFDFPENRGDDLWLDSAYQSDYRVGMRVVQCAPANAVLVDEEVLKQHETLKNLLAIKQRTGTSFREDNEITRCALRELWNSQDSLSDPNVEISGVEGIRRLRTHAVYERDARLVSKKKQQFIEAKSNLYCELCGFDFGKEYGDLGAGFIEVHHVVPVSTNKERKTMLDDLMCVCSNCHRMLHRNANLDENLAYLRSRLNPSDRN